MDKNVLKLSFKLFLRLFGLDFCCLITSIFVMAPGGNQIVRVLLQAASIIVLVSFVYPICHKTGDLDAPLVNAGHRKRTSLKGLYAGTIACLPFIISAIILLLSKLFNAFFGFVNYYRIINSIFFPFLYSIMPVDYTLSELSSSSIVMAICIQFVIPLICMFSYILGFNRFSFAEKLLYKKKAN